MLKNAVRWIVLIVIGVVVVGAVVLALMPSPVGVDAGDVSTGLLRISVDEEGKTRIRERYVVSSPLVGRLRRITLDPGDPVDAQSTVLAVIEPTNPDLLDARALAEAEARVRAAQAALRQSGTALESAKAAVDFAENELTRISTAFAQGAANQHELDTAQTSQRTASEAYSAAQYGQEITKFELEVAQSALLYARGESDPSGESRMALTSPIDGVVLRVMQESVAVVNPGTPLIEVGDPTDLEIVIDVLSTDAVGIRPGDRVLIEHWGGDAPLEAIVRLVEPSAFTEISALGIEEQRVNVVVDFVSPESDRATLGDGFRVEGSIVIWEEPRVLQIPTSALFRINGDGDRWAAFRITDGRAVLTTVTLGKQNGRASQILDGLSDGDRVVLHPNDRVHDGVRVEPRSTYTSVR